MNYFNPAGQVDGADRRDERTMALYRTHQRELFVATDRLFLTLLVFQLILALAFSLWVAPNTWIGRSAEAATHVWVDFGLTVAISLLLIGLIVTQPGRPFIRYAIAVGQIAISALLIHLSGGRIETHFHVFGSLAFLSLLAQRSINQIDDRRYNGMTTY